MEIQTRKWLLQDSSMSGQSSDHLPLQSCDHHTCSASSSSSYIPSSYDTPYGEAIRALTQICNVHIPTIECVDAVMVKAMLHVISCPSSSSSVINSSQFLPPAPISPVFNRRKQSTSSFKTYRPSLGPRIRLSGRNQTDSMLKRSIALLRKLNTDREEEQTSSSSTHLHHIISERLRREKLNESFYALRSLLPPGTKRDKASVLAVATEYYTCLEAQVSELSQRNQTLEGDLLLQKAAAEVAIWGSFNQTTDVGIVHLGESFPGVARMMDLVVIRRGEASILDMVTDLLEFLKKEQKIILISVEASTKLVDSTPVNCIVSRLIMEGVEWEEAAFQEDVRRVFSQ